MTVSDVLGLPVLVSASAANITNENEANLIREALIRGTILDRDLTAPPGGEAEGDIYIPAATATGAWAGKEGFLAIKSQSTSGGWFFKAKWAGCSFWIVDEATALTWNGASWIADDGSSSLPLAGGTMSGDINLGNNDIVNIATVAIGAGSASHPLDVVGNARLSSALLASIGKHYDNSTHVWHTTGTTLYLGSSSAGAGQVTNIAMTPSTGVGIGATPASGAKFHVTTTADANAVRVSDSLGTTGLGVAATAASKLTVAAGSLDGVVVTGLGTSKWGFKMTNGTQVNGAGIVTLGANGSQLLLRDGTSTIWRLYSDTTTSYTSGGGKFAFGSTTAAAQVQITQPSTTAAIPCLELDQDDTDQPFIEFDGTSAADAGSSLSSWTAGNTIQGFARVTINGTVRWIPFYDAPTS